MSNIDFIGNVNEKESLSNTDKNDLAGNKKASPVGSMSQQDRLSGEVAEMNQEIRNPTQDYHTSNDVINLATDQPIKDRHQSSSEAHIRTPESKPRSPQSKSLLSHSSISNDSDRGTSGNQHLTKLQLQTFINSIFDHINHLRSSNNCSTLFQDIGLTIIANEYALLEEDFHLNQMRFSQIVKKNKFIGKVTKCFISYDFFDEEDIDMNSIEVAIGQCLSIFLELKEEVGILLQKEMNSVGIGIAVVNGRLSLCLCFSEISIRLTKVKLNAIGKLEIEGQLLIDNYGIYIMQISSIDDNEKFLITPQNISYDAEKNEFLACIEFNCNLDAIEKIVEIFVKSDPSTIKYGVANNIKYIPKHYEPCYSFPLIKYPFTKVNERKFSKMLNILPNSNFTAHKPTVGFSQDHLSEKSVSNSEYKIKSRTHHSKEGSSISENDDTSEIDHESSQIENSNVLMSNKAMSSKFKKNAPYSICEYDFGKQYEETESPRTGEDGLKRELEDALYEARKELQKQITKNKGLQTKVWFKLKSNKGREMKSAFINNEYNTNDMKYANSLALNTEIRNELKQIKDKYQQASRHIVLKFEEKKSRFNEIKDSFASLRQEVCKNAIYETTMKKIPQRILDEVDNRESHVNDSCNDLRLEIISMRMELEKNLKLLANKEELADGLHLIDFEKLKIENQSLSEKIEERNDEIYKLTNKNNVNVHILAHVKEKLKWEQDKIQDLVSDFNQIGDIIRRGVPNLQKVSLHFGQGSQISAEAHAQTHPGNWNHKK